ncbi:MAG: MoaD/ThiS family protein [Candidatus Poseidoniales archaeon]|nr:MoaD/ThiS family protein [Candidatus Poseidoniales archaeon]RJV00850.1 MAG: MoaD/ThiS family protein [Candidatus Poseidoniales archaeon]
MQVKVLAFGPLAEEMGGREHIIDILPNSSVRFVLEEINLEKWLSQGLIVSLNGEKVQEDEPVNDGDEIALLPPVSGG